MYWYFEYMYVWFPQRQEVGIHFHNWSYRQLWDTMWARQIKSFVLNLKSTQTSALNLQPHLLVFENERAFMSGWRMGLMRKEGRGGDMMMDVFDQNSLYMWWSSQGIEESLFLFFFFFLKFTLGWGDGLVCKVLALQASGTKFIF